jgi:hypothetical protein
MEEPHSESPLENDKYTDDLSNYLFCLFGPDQGLEIINGIYNTSVATVLALNSAG